MTQSGQGHDPQNSAAGPAREGVVLPAGGGGDAWVPAQQAAPPAGQPWGQPWGPGQQPPGQQPEYGQGQSQPYGQAPGHGFPSAPSQGKHAAAPASAPLPEASPQQPAAPLPQQPLPPQNQGFPQGQQPLPPMPSAPPQQASGQPAPEPAAAQQAGAPLPPAAADAEATALISFGAQAPQPAPADQSAPGAHAAPSGGLPPESGPHAAAQQPDPYGPQAPGPYPAASGEVVRATRQAGAPLPPAANEATTFLTPVAGRPAGAPGAAPLPPEAAGESTQLLRPVRQNQGPAQGQPLPQSAPMPGAVPTDGSEATQLIPPVGGGATPAPQPGAAAYGAPGAHGDRPTPAEFEGLFRAEPAAPGGVPAPDATAQLPRVEDPGRPAYGQHGGYGQQFPPGGGLDQPAAYEGGGGRGRGKLPPAVIIGVIVVALAGAGLGLGWALSGGSSGGDDPGKKQDPGTSTAKSAKDDGSKTAGDPAEAQAKGLDALLGDSNNSRSSVIGAVQSIKSCTNLDGAAKDLRSAAGQRNDLVKRLQQLPVDKIPNNAALTAALTKAWQSSAAADNSYAAWADKAAGKEGCDDGHPKGGKEASQGNAASGDATTAKQQAAGIWNPIAQKYGLTQHQPEQL
ncbi:hypothetical protein [Streptomyces albospinus]|uniref:hypothetical protein n=1 Tax=Streptomyces albospinus TaxID=285515 RepID=UPI001E54D7DF|nr:hypothetical protein [Streptomyces albospinus]